MNKRGDTTVWHEIVKAIPAMLLVLILLAAGVKIYNSLHPEKYSVEKKDLLRIVSEIKDLKKDDKVIVPMFSKDYNLIGMNMAKITDKSVYQGCNLNYCVCILKNSQPIVCESFNLKEEFMTGYGSDKCELDGKDFKNVLFDSPTTTSTNNPIKIDRTGICSVKIYNS